MAEGFDVRSDDGTRMAYAVREGGVDEVSIRIRDVDTDEDLAHVLPAARFGEVTLAPYGGRLYYEGSRAVDGSRGAALESRARRLAHDICRTRGA